MTNRLLTSLTILILLAAAAPCEAVTPAKTPGLESLVGERHFYRISFLWFDELARGELRLAPGERGGTYRAVLEAETLGLAAWVSGHQVRRYISLMEKGSDGRLRPLSHEAHRIRGRGRDRSDFASRYVFDYSRGEIGHQRLRDGTVVRKRGVSGGTEEIPCDFLTAFYNFRIGAYGPAVPGSRHVVPVLAGEEIAPMVVEILPESEHRRHYPFPEEGLLGRVLLDPGILGTKGGSVYVWFDDTNRPARGLVENVIGLGDVRGSVVTIP